MNGGKPPVRRNVLHDHTGEPLHLLQRINPKDGTIHTRCGLGYTKNVLGRGRVRTINLRSNRLSCTRCQDVANYVITDADNYHQGELYEQ